VTSETITAAAAGTWTLGDLTVNRIGFGAMRLTSNVDGTPSDRGRAVTVLRQLGRDHLDVVNLRVTPTSWPSPERTTRRPRRSGWPGRCSKDRTCWPSREPGTRST